MGNTVFAASKHAALGCTTCHADEDALTIVHANATESAVGNADADAAKDTVNCRTCHDRKAIAAKTQDTLVKGDGKSTANPHSNHVSVDAKCTDCHKIHAVSTLTCSECHDFVLPEGWE